MAAEIGLDSDRVADTLSDLGLPGAVIPPGIAQGTLRAYTPGFDPAARLPGGAPDLLKRNGGLEVLAALNVPGLGARADFRLGLALDATGRPTSLDGAGSISAARFGPVSNISGTVDLTVNQGSASFRVRGTATFNGAVVTVDGTLDQSGNGSLTLGLGGSGLDLGGFRLTGQLVATSRAGVVTVSVNGTVDGPRLAGDSIRIQRRHRGQRHVHLHR